MDKKHKIGIFSEWIEKLANIQKRLYYRDQNTRSLSNLIEIAEEYNPDKIIELGTAYGLSLRAWSMADTQTKIISVDFAHDVLKKSSNDIPVEWEKISLIQTDIMKYSFADLWNHQDKVILYIDVHDDSAPLMNYILTHIVKNMPKGSKVVIDDVWFSDQLIKSNNVIDYFYQSMVHEIDPLLYFKGSYANYWEKGSFFGFREIIPFLNWVNHNHIQLKFEKGVKHIHFELNNPADYDYECLNDIQLNNYGSNDYNPVDLLLDENSMDPSLVKLYQSAKTSYAQANIDQALKQFLELSSSMQNQNHLLYAIAVCYSRLGQYDRALAAINKELDLNEPFILADSLKVKLTERI